MLADQYYATATQPNNQNILFLIPELGPQEGVREPEAQALQVEQKEAEGVREEPHQRDLAQAEDSTYEQQQAAPEKGHQVTNGQEDSTMAIQEIQDDKDPSDTDLLDREKDNATHSRILGKEIIIYFK